MSTHRTYLEHPIMWIRIAAVALVLGAPLAMAATPVLLSPGVAIESSTDTVTEPLVDGGLFMARSCEACRSPPPSRCTPRRAAKSRSNRGRRESIAPKRLPRGSGQSVTQFAVFRRPDAAPRLPPPIPPS